MSDWQSASEFEDHNDLSILNQERDRREYGRVYPRREPNGKSSKLIEMFGAKWALEAAQEELMRVVWLRPQTPEVREQIIQAQMRVDSCRATYDLRKQEAKNVA